ncbi:MAG: hypothetical protein AAF485_16190 [Chloroflexota bacterium]
MLNYYVTHRPRFIIGLILFILIMGCSLPSLPFGQESSSLPPTRTPLPTFTPTQFVQESISIPPTPTVTPIPTETPTLAPAEPAPTETPVPAEPTPTETPVPTDTPQPAAPTSPPPPTEPPPPPEPSGPVVGAHGVIGTIEFRDGRNTYGIGERIFVRINVRTPSGSGQVPFGILGLTTSTGAFQTSWSDGVVNGQFNHEDGIPINAPGNHKLWLSVCFSGLDACQGANGDWERFEPGLDVIIQ